MATTEPTLLEVGTENNVTAKTHGPNPGIVGNNDDITGILEHLRVSRGFEQPSATSATLEDDTAAADVTSGDIELPDAVPKPVKEKHIIEKGNNHESELPGSTSNEVVEDGAITKGGSCDVEQPNVTSAASNENEAVGDFGSKDTRTPKSASKSSVEDEVMTDGSLFGGSTGSLEQDAPAECDDLPQIHEATNLDKPEQKNITEVATGGEEVVAEKPEYNPEGDGRDIGNVTLPLSEATNNGIDRGHEDSITAQPADSNTGFVETAQDQLANEIPDSQEDQVEVDVPMHRDQVEEAHQLAARTLQDMAGANGDNPLGVRVEELGSTDNRTDIDAEHSVLKGILHGEQESAHLNESQEANHASHSMQLVGTERFNGENTGNRNESRLIPMAIAEEQQRPLDHSALASQWSPRTRLCSDYKPGPSHNASQERVISPDTTIRTQSQASEAIVATPLQPPKTRQQHMVYDSRLESNPYYPRAATSTSVAAPAAVSTHEHDFVSDPNYQQHEASHPGAQPPSYHHVAQHGIQGHSDSPPYFSDSQDFPKDAVSDRRKTAQDVISRINTQEGELEPVIAPAKKLKDAVAHEEPAIQASEQPRPAAATATPPNVDGPGIPAATKENISMDFEAREHQRPLSSHSSSVPPSPPSEDGTDPLAGSDGDDQKLYSQSRPHQSYNADAALALKLDEEERIRYPMRKRSRTQEGETPSPTKKPATQPTPRKRIKLRLSTPKVPEPARPTPKKSSPKKPKVFREGTRKNPRRVSEATNYKQ